MRLRIFLIFWTALAVIFAAQGLLHQILRDGSLHWSKGLLQASGVYTWAALSPVVIWLSRRYPFGRRSWRRSLLIHLAAVVMMVPIDGGTYYLTDTLFTQTLVWNKSLDGWDRFARVLVTTCGFSVFWYAGIVAVSHALGYYEMLRQRELHLARAQMQVLRMQLQPHFLFNTLNAIAALVHDDPRAADRMIARLSEFLRLTLKEGERQEVRLEEEIDFLRPYLEIQKIRFSDRLTVDLQIDPETLDAGVPNLLLQPLVENAVNHGIAPRSGPGHIAIRSRRSNGRIELEVQDDGVGLNSAATVRGGVGLGNTRARLQKLYGEDHELILESADGGGVRVRVAFPYRPAPARVEGGLS